MNKQWKSKGEYVNKSWNIDKVRDFLEYANDKIFAL